MAADRIPETAFGRELRGRVSDERWRQLVADADTRAAMMNAVFTRHAEAQVSWRTAVAEAAPGVPWPTFVSRKRSYDERTGPGWERMLDRRVPPDQSHPKEVELAACLLRQLDPTIGVSATREHLMRRFGEVGGVSDTWLKRVWVAAGLNRPGGGTSEQPGMTEETFHGGGALALLAAVELEQGTTVRLAEALQSAGALSALQQELAGGAACAGDKAGRADDGRFTGVYNAVRREGTAPGEADDRWATDAAKASQRALGGLPSLAMKQGTLTAKLLAMGVTPLLTERRGFDGLEGPAGEWLGVLGGVAYMPATLDKALAEFGVLDVSDALWATHAGSWHQLSSRWCEPGGSWPQSVAYIDGTADPYWTRAYAASGKVSRVNRVMPCLTRLAIHSGAGVPLYVETHAGTASLKERLLPMLTKLDEVVGPEAQVGRLTIVDAEMGTAGAMLAMHEQTDMAFITVVKGAAQRGAQLRNEQPWQPYRERDQVRDVDVVLRGKGVPQEGVCFRGVQMLRAGGRSEQTTLFVTNAEEDELSAAEVVTRYLTRWPRQEQKFALGRDGGGLNRSHGYGGEFVTHAVLEDKQATAARSVGYAQRRLDLAAELQSDLAEASAEWPAKARRQVDTLVNRNQRERQQALARTEKRQAKLSTMPDQIYVRDIGRDSVMTCLKLNVLSMIEFALQEYFGGLRMSWRTFIEQFVALPVTIRQNKARLVYVFHANRRQPERMAQLQVAIDELNRRKLQRGGQQLTFELKKPPAG